MRVLAVPCTVRQPLRICSLYVSDIVCLRVPGIFVYYAYSLSAIWEALYVNAAHVWSGFIFLDSMLLPDWLCVPDREI